MKREALKVLREDNNTDKKYFANMIVLCGYYIKPDKLILVNNDSWKSNSIQHSKSNINCLLERSKHVLEINQLISLNKADKNRAITPYK